jgi:hemolysin III
LKPVMAKKVFQIIDHCTIFILIAGTYTPIVLSAIRPAIPWMGWTVFGFVWGLSALGIVLNAIDLKRYSKLSMALYILLGWCIVLTGKNCLLAVGKAGMLWLLAGGIAYTVGAIFYGVGGHGKCPHPQRQGPQAGPYLGGSESGPHAAVALSVQRRAVSSAF